MFSAALRGNGSHGAFDDFQKCLLYAFARYVARDRHIFALSCDLIDFVDIDDAALSAGNVVIGVLNKFQKDIFHVFAHIARFGECGGVCRGERNVQYLRKRFCKKRFSAARRA